MADTQGTDNVYRLPGAVDATTGSGGGGYDARLAKLQSDVEHVQSDIKEIKTDIRIFFGAAVVGGLGILGVMAKGFGWL